MSRSLSRLTLSSLALVTLLAACDTSPTPDYRIKLMPSADGKSTIAVPPECASWHTENNSPLENLSGRQFGCATAHNLAAQVADPNDLIEGDKLGKPDAIFTAATVRDYRMGKSKSLIDPQVDGPVPATPTNSGVTQ
ncbi:MAG TPA: hypothetical protein DCY07_07000 [Rhodospirillaceae bacterium]|nr:hypothetical protein [Rhodospirillaceae bacterium]